MRIDDVRPDTTAAAKARATAPVTGPTRARHADGGQTDRADEVVISAEGRALAAQAQSADATGALPADRLAELRRWIQTGGFDSPEAMDGLTRRLLSSGEI